MPSIHATALLDPSLDLPEDLEVGPYAVLESGVSLGRGVRIGPFCHLYPGTRLGDRVILADGVVLGHAPQDLKYRGESTSVEIGEGAVLREYVTVNRGTAASGVTRVGRNAYLMAYVHVAHDCALGDGAIVANGVQMGGHVSIGAGAVISGMTGIHQFVTVGPGVFVGGCLRVDKDIPPYSKALGDPLAWGGINEIGLAKLGFQEAARKALKRFYRGLFDQGVDAALRELQDPEPAQAEPGSDSDRLRADLLEFFDNRRRGLLGRRK
jgi:UDP-N-acetylglucosamine acyltransferase